MTWENLLERARGHLCVYDVHRVCDTFEWYSRQHIAV